MKDTDIPLVSKESWESSQSSVRESDKCVPWSISLGGRNAACLPLCASRAKQLHRCSRRAILQVLETSHLFELYAHDLTKASSTLASLALLGPPPPPPLDTELNHEEQPKPVSTLQQLTTASVAFYLAIVKSIKSVAADSFERFLVTYDDACRLACERHVTSRRRAEKARQKALTAHSVYASVHQEVHAALVEWYQEHTDQTDIPAKLVAKLSQRQSCEARYKRLVAEENECVRQCERLEHMALESLQMLEHDRCVIAMYGWNKVWHTTSKRSSASEKSAMTEPMEYPLEALYSDKKSPKRVAARRKGSLGHTSSITEECAGAMDAETLGLPMEIGQLRDQVQSLATTRLQTVHATRVVQAFVDAVAHASLKFVQGLQQQQTNGLDSVRDAMKAAHECDGVAQVWNALVTSVASLGAAPTHLAAQLHALASDPRWTAVWTHGNDVLKPYTERDNATWKQLCEAARSQARAEARYQEATAHKARARERCRSMDSVGLAGGTGISTSGSTSTASLVNVAGKHMTQSIASMLSILPNAEHAMKVLDPSMRASAAHSHLEEADHKETKERQLLDSAMELTSLSLEAYKSSAETLLQHCENKLDGYGTILISLVELWKEFQSAQRCESSKEHGSMSMGRTWAKMDEYLNSWSEQVKEGLAGDFDSDLERTDPFLSVQLEESEVVQKALKSVDNNSEAALDASEGALDDETDVDLMEDGTENTAVTTPLRERAASASSVIMPSKSPMDESATSWLRSLTDTDSIFGKLSMTRKIPRLQQLDLVVDTETNIFARYFWPDELEMKMPTHILDSFACSFRDGSQRFPFQYGRVFMATDQIMFVGWTRKQLTLLWTSVVEVTPVQNRLSDQSELVVKCRKNGTAEESYMILSGFYDRPNALMLIEKLREQKRQSLVAPTPVPTDCATPPPTPSRQSDVSEEVTMAKMVAVVSSGRLEALSIPNYYDTIWSERDDETMKPFYKPWLEKECFDVEVGPWQSGDFVGSWCGESYTQKREVSFKVKRKSHLYIGPPIANVMQTHLCRIEGSDRCVVQIRVEIDGIPYGDTFAVEIRWVATRDGDSDILIDVGVEVDFKKSTFLKGKIRAGTMEETTLVHKDLFASIQSRCASESGIEHLLPTVIEPLANVDIENTTKGIHVLDWKNGVGVAVGCGVLILFVLLRRFISTRTEGTCLNMDERSSDTSAYELQALGAKMDHLESELVLVRNALDEILSLMRRDQDDT